MNANETIHKPKENMRTVTVHRYVFDTYSRSLYIFLFNFITDTLNASFNLNLNISNTIWSRKI